MFSFFNLLFSTQSFCEYVDTSTFCRLSPLCFQVFVSSSAKTFKHLKLPSAIAQIDTCGRILQRTLSQPKRYTLRHDIDRQSYIQYRYIDIVLQTRQSIFIGVQQGPVACASNLVACCNWIIQFMLKTVEKVVSHTTLNCQVANVKMIDKC